ncbi:PREDICTED: DNA-directed RNA polymerase III subunit RPC7-like [Amphimedon queenslandica]|uniref:DNA-directed RNA polymerase III subunit n=1 Tax=Amphimedon queenslandica TaxID=400682 RepID=A0A1X7UBG7_AMPQE|nr:PREDICTED: DNA-directed RNA polymerase III subunit RPC7-like [Amphimedon queenslandica]|eukprot:XP_011405594.1 PREDICTED: DNA-directed RNA polymerase III subunit RPC7-like [Amphimedon queenslandica]
MSRGRRRGSGRPASNLEGLGVPPGERIPPPSLEPSPLFPPLDKRPLDLTDNELYVELLGKKSSLRVAMQDSVFYLRKSQRDHELNIVRYSDKYKTKDETDIMEILASTPSWQQRLPKELHPKTKRTIKKAQRHKKALKPTSGTQFGTSKLNIADTTSPPLGDTITVGSIDLINIRAGYTEGEEEVGEEEEEEVYDEEEEEEQGDYQLSYFDPGGDDVMIDDDDEEGGAGGEYY